MNHNQNDGLLKMIKRTHDLFYVENLDVGSWGVKNDV